MIQFEVDSPLGPEAVLGALTDFSERRPELWPVIDPKVYRVHEVSASSALVTEGTDVMGGIWATELYEWNGSGAVPAHPAVLEFVDRFAVGTGIEGSLIEGSRDGAARAQA